ncbi:MAG TPA: DUF4157 domain-containing protein [Pyrinomonadaceae bacterium]|nr:DUF4157 domain-containing protein [Pyrinomonadaceae bacterium]
MRQGFRSRSSKKGQLTDSTPAHESRDATPSLAHEGSQASAQAQRVPAYASGPEPAMPLTGDIVQPKLAVSHPNDPGEREADAVANGITSGNTTETVAASPQTTPEEEQKPEEEVQRKCDACEEEEESVQRETPSSQATEGVSVSDSFDQNLGAGQPIDAPTRSFFESRMGHDFEGVRVHTDAESARSARSIDALAYTRGKDVVFGHGQYAPGTKEGDKLLAHELTHVVQQERVASHTVERQATPPDPLREARCLELLALIRQAVAELVRRASELLADPLGLQWDNWTTPRILPGGTNVGSVQGHQQQFQNWQQRLRKLIQRWDDDDCNSTGRRVTREERELAHRETPAPIPRPRPQTAPRPWNAPGTAPDTSGQRRAAATGVLIGGAVGTVLGGIIGGVLGGAGGTLVAPGFGTVGGGAAGAVGGMEAGALVGGVAGGAIGGIIGWFTGS